jgi:UDP-N-acetylmuramyl pentapeptide phosphotransferase/UDP-N-acetylglucosamine-1-phosphate transferase
VTALPIVALVPWFGAAALATAALVARLRHWAVQRDLLDHPNHRSSHAVPTPRIGGVGLACVWLGGLAWLAWRSSPGPTSMALLTVCLLGLAVAAISLYDDVRSVAPQYRFLAHVGAAACVVTLVGAVDRVDAAALGQLRLSWPVAQVLTLLWVVSLVNAVNFIDGIDGMAGAQAAVAGLGWIVLGLLSGATTLALAGALLSGAAIGFLVHNWSPARIFMGDGGSALLGFLLATVPWVLGGSTLWLATACVLWPTLLDTSWTLATRLIKGMPVWQSHRMHMYQQLVAAGRAPAHVSAAYASASLAGLVVAVLMRQAPQVAPVAASVTMIAFVGWAMSARRWHRAPAAGAQEG